MSRGCTTTADVTAAATTPRHPNQLLRARVRVQRRDQRRQRQGRRKTPLSLQRRLLQQECVNRKTTRRPCTPPDPPRELRKAESAPRASLSSFQERNFQLALRTAGSCGCRTASTRTRPSGSAKTEGRLTAGAKVDARRRNACCRRCGRCPVHRLLHVSTRETWCTRGPR